MDDYKIPDPKGSPAKALVIYFKVLKGNEFDDRLWDKKHFARNMVSAVDLLEICGSYEIAKFCLIELGEKYDEKELSWSLETIARNAHEWKNKGKRNDKQNRQRFFDALARQRSEAPDTGTGKGASAGTILDTMGSLKILRGEDGN